MDISHRNRHYQPWLISIGCEIVTFDCPITGCYEQISPPFSLEVIYSELIAGDDLGNLGHSKRCQNKATTWNRCIRFSFNLFYSGKVPFRRAPSATKLVLVSTQTWIKVIITFPSPHYLYYSGVFQFSVKRCYGEATYPI